MLLETFDEDPGSNDELLGRMSLDISSVRQRGSVDQVSTVTHFYAEAV